MKKCFANQAEHSKINITHHVPARIKTRLQTPHTQVVTLNPSRNTLHLANHTKNVDLETSRTHNTPWQDNYKSTVIKEEGNRIHLGITKLKVQNYNPILFHTLKNDPKLFQILEKLFW